MISIPSTFSANLAKLLARSIDDDSNDRHAMRGRAPWPPAAQTRQRRANARYRTWKNKRTPRGTTADPR